MIPLIPSYAITIHKSQGQTLDKIIINLGHREFASGLTYTALSRTTKLQNIRFDTVLWGKSGQGQIWYRRGKYRTVKIKK